MILYFLINQLLLQMLNTSCPGFLKESEVLSIFKPGLIHIAPVFLQLFLKILVYVIAT